MLALVTACGGSTHDGGASKAGAGASGPAYGSGVSASEVEPCSLLTAEEATSAMPGGKYATGRSSTGNTGIPICALNDEALGGFINVLVQSSPTVQGWLATASQALNYQAGAENGPWDYGLAGCTARFCGVAFLIGQVDVTVLGAPGSAQKVDEDFAAGIGVAARDAATRFARSSGSAVAPSPAAVDSTPPQMSLPYPAATDTASPDGAGLRRFLQRAAIPVYLFAPQGDPDALRVTVRKARLTLQTDGPTTVTALVRNDGRTPVRPSIALIFAEAGFTVQDPSQGIAAWYAEAQPSDSNCIAPGGSAPITWNGEVPDSYEQVVMKDSTTRSGDC